MEIIRKTFSGGLSLGMLITASAWLASHFWYKPDVIETKVFQRENKPAVMRLYRPGRDGIMVEQEGKYTPIGNYLATIQNEADREVERAEIRKSVRWYEE